MASPLPNVPKVPSSGWSGIAGSLLKRNEPANAPAPPPPPPASRPAPAFGPPAPSPGNARYDEAMRAIESLSPPDPGSTRLYRVGEVATNYKQPESIRGIAWIHGTDGPVPAADWHKIRDDFMASEGIKNTSPSDAAGRWFGSRAEDIDYYVGDSPGAPVYYLDMPADQASAYSVKNTPFSSSSSNPDREFVIPDEHLRRSVRLLEGLTK